MKFTVLFLAILFTSVNCGIISEKGREELYEICKGDVTCIEKGAVCFNTFRDLYYNVQKGEGNLQEKLSKVGYACLAESNLVAQYDAFVPPVTAGPSRVRRMIYFLRDLNQSDPATTKTLRCCLMNSLASVTNGKLNKKVFKQKFAELTADTINKKLKEAFIKAVDTCEAPKECNILGFSQCMVKSCIEAL